MSELAQGDNPVRASIAIRHLAAGALRTAIALCMVSQVGCETVLGLNDIVPDGEPVSLVLTPPSQGVVQQPLDLFTVVVADIRGEPAPGFTGEVTLAFGKNPTGAALLGTVTARATAGIARFDLVAMDRPGTGYTLVASGAGLPPVTSTAIDIVAPTFTPVATGLAGGPITSITIAPAAAGAPATVYVGAADGVYKSVDGAGTWKPASFGADVAGRVLADPSHPGVVYLARGNSENFFFLKKTVDGGATWHYLGLDNAEVASSQVYAFALDPRNPSTIYVAGTKLYRSTDSGTTWSAISSDPICTQISVDPVAANTLYCIGANPATGGPNGIYKSSNGGTSWTPAASPSLSAALLGATPKAIFISSNGALFRSIDGAASWIPVATGTAFPYAVTYAPSNPNRVYLSMSNGISVSNDGGASFGAAVPTGDLVQTLVTDPTNADVVVGAGRSFGVVLSTNGGVSWAAASKGIDARPIISIALAPGAPSTMLATTNGNVLRTINGGTTWTSVSPATGYVRFDPAMATRAYLCGYSYFATSTNSGATFTGGNVASLLGNCDDLVMAGATMFAVGQGRMLKSIDSGASWAATGSLSNASPIDVALGDAAGSVVVATTSRGLFRSTDGGTSFKQIGGSDSAKIITDPTAPTHLVVGDCPGFRTSPDGGSNFGASITGPCVLALGASGTALYAAGIAAHGNATVVMTSRDSGLSWTPINTGGIPSGLVVSSITASDDGKTIYVGTPGGIYKATR